MRVRVDADLCEGYGTCAQILPEVFLLDELGYAHVAEQGEVPPDKVAAAREAIAVCPMSAISDDEMAAESSEPPIAPRQADGGNDRSGL